jgi:hypothetical protein
MVKNTAKICELFKFAKGNLFLWRLLKFFYPLQYC